MPERCEQCWGEGCITCFWTGSTDVSQSEILGERIASVDEFLDEEIDIDSDGYPITDEFA